MSKLKFVLISLTLSTGLAHAGVTPYTDQDHLPRIANIDLLQYELLDCEEHNGVLDPTTCNLDPKKFIVNETEHFDTVTADDIINLVENMKDHAQTDETLGNYIGVRTGMALRKDGNWEEKLVRNWQGLSALPVPIWEITENNVSWKAEFTTITTPDNQVLNALKLTSGKFNMGTMPFKGQAFMQIPSKFIKKEKYGTKYWFHLYSTRCDLESYTGEEEEDEKCVTLDVDENGDPYSENFQKLNYYKVLITEEPIVNFFGYYDTATGEWNVKFVVNSDTVIIPSDYDDSLPSWHPPLRLEVYSKGYAL